MRFSNFGKLIKMNLSSGGLQDDFSSFLTQKKEDVKLFIHIYSPACETPITFSRCFFQNFKIEVNGQMSLFSPILLGTSYFSESPSMTSVLLFTFSSPHL